MIRKSSIFLMVLLSLSAISCANEGKDMELLPGKYQIRGADLSMVAQVEEMGGKYYDIDGTEKDVFEILGNNGVNWLRLRIWNNPNNIGGGNNDLQKTILLARRGKKQGMNFLLDFHYSDFWADPSTQNKPKDWEYLSGLELENAVYEYTLNVLTTLKNENLLPDMVQIGNEIDGGFLWPDGKTWTDTNEKIGGYPVLTNLLKQASKAVREIAPNAKIVIHLSSGCNNGLYRYFFDEITKANVDFDVIGLSYYSYWHGYLADLVSNMKDMVSRYKKEVLVAETAYGWTLKYADTQPNVFQVFGDGSEYPATVDGQRKAIKDVINAVSSVEGGLGVFYWEPAWIPVDGAGWKTGEGNNWENQTLFDFNGKALPSIDVFKEY